MECDLLLLQDGRTSAAPAFEADGTEQIGQWRALIVNGARR